MTSILNVAKNDTATMDIVFVHGLGGNAKNYWMADKNDEKTFWPEWLSEDLTAAASPCNVWSLDYEAKRFAFGKRDALPLQSRSISALDRLRSEGIGERPIVFITHSLGGLLVKAMLRDAIRFDETFEAIAKKTRGVVFIATPHAGAELAKTLKSVAGLFTTPAIDDLIANSHQLLHLGADYRSLSSRFSIRTLAYGETKKTPQVQKLIVPGSSADPGVEGVPLVELDEDHLSICKPKDKDSLLYKSLKHWILKGIANQEELGVWPLGSGFVPERKGEDNDDPKYIDDGRGFSITGNWHIEAREKPIVLTRIRFDGWNEGLTLLGTVMEVKINGEVPKSNGNYWFVPPQRIESNGVAVLSVKRLFGPPFAGKGAPFDYKDAELQLSIDYFCDGPKVTTRFFKSSYTTNGLIEIDHLSDVPYLKDEQFREGRKQNIIDDNELEWVLQIAPESRVRCMEYIRAGKTNKFLLIGLSRSDADKLQSLWERIQSSLN